MPIRVIILSVVWGLLSTAFVRPWFYKALKKKNLEDEYGIFGVDDCFSVEGILICELIFFLITFFLSFIFYLWIGCRYNIFGSFLLIIIAAFFQIVHNNQRPFSYFILGLIIFILIILLIEEGIAISNFIVPLEVTSEVDFNSTKFEVEKDENNERTIVVESTLFFSNEAIKTAFNVNNVEDPVLSNNRIIYAVSGGENGLGVVYIKRDSPNKAYFIPCKYQLDVAQIRKLYPDNMIDEVKVVMSNENIPYALYAVAERKILEPYEISKYVLRNMQTGECLEYTQDKLPEFVTEK